MFRRFMWKFDRYNKQWIFIYDSELKYAIEKRYGKYVFKIVAKDRDGEFYFIDKKEYNSLELAKNHCKI